MQVVVAIARVVSFMPAGIVYECLIKADLPISCACGGALRLNDYTEIKIKKRACVPTYHTHVHCLEGPRRQAKGEGMELRLLFCSSVVKQTNECASLLVHAPSVGKAQS